MTNTLSTLESLVERAGGGVNFVVWFFVKVCGLLDCAMIVRSIPLRDQILTRPSSPTVAQRDKNIIILHALEGRGREREREGGSHSQVSSAEPSWLQTVPSTAPLCASTAFSTRPSRDTSRNVPESVVYRLVGHKLSCIFD